MSGQEGRVCPASTSGTKVPSPTRTPRFPCVTWLTSGTRGSRVPALPLPYSQDTDPGDPHTRDPSPTRTHGRRLQSVSQLLPVRNQYEDRHIYRRESTTTRLPYIFFSPFSGTVLLNLPLLRISHRQRSSVSLVRKPEVRRPQDSTLSDYRHSRHQRSRLRGVVNGIRSTTRLRRIDRILHPYTA